MIDHYYPPLTVVRVVVPGDLYTGQTGTVTATRNDAGDMVHRVVFAGGSADFLGNELRALHTKHQPTQGNT
jgi:hypothetical protein